MNFMQKKTFKFILLSTLLCITTNNMFAKKGLKHLKNKPEYSFYESNQWNYVEKKIVEKSDKKLEFQSLKTFGVFLLSAGAALGLGGFLYDKVDRDSPVFVACLAIPIILLGTCFYHKINKDRILKETLRSVLRNYSPNLEIGRIFNTKNYLPKELWSTFDSLHKIHKKHGDLFWERGGEKIMDFIIEKIKHEMKPSKYSWPKNNTNVVWVNNNR